MYNMCVCVQIYNYIYIYGLDPNCFQSTKLYGKTSNDVTNQPAQSLLSQQGFTFRTARCEHLGPIAAGNIERLRRRGLAQPNPVTLAPYPTHLLFQAVPI